MTPRQSKLVRQRHSVDGGDSGELDDKLDELHALLESEYEQRSFLERIGKQPGAALILIVNFVPAVLALWLDWDPFAIVLVYWFENGVIGLVNLLKIAFARPRMRTEADVLIGLHQADIFALPRVSREFLSQLQRRPADRIPAAKSFALAAFLLTFPAFMALHAAVLFSVFEGVGPAGLWSELRASLGAGLGLALAALAIEHLWSFAYEFVYRGGFLRTIPILQVAQPYPKLIVIHVALFAGVLIAQFLPAGAIAAVALVLLKTALDMGLILRIPIKASGLKKMLQETDGREDLPPAPRSREIARHAGGPLSLSLARVGLRATSRRFSGLLLASTLLAVFGGVIFGAFGVGPIGMAVAGRFDFFSSVWSFFVPVVGVPLGGLLLALGLTTLHSAVRAGWTRAEIRVTDGKLEISERGPVIWRRARCAQADIEEIAVVKSGVAVNNVPFCLIEVRRRDSRPALEVLYGRPEVELNQVAVQLRATLGLDSAGEPESESAAMQPTEAGATALHTAAPTVSGRPV